MKKLVDWSKPNTRDKALVAVNVAGTALNLGWALAFPDGYFTWLNWFAGGFCAGVAMFQPTINKLRRLVDDQHASIVAGNAAMDAVSPTQMRTMLHGALTEVVAQMKRDGVLPADTEITISQDNLPKSLH